MNLSVFCRFSRGFSDPLSVRLDEPLYAKIDGAAGMAGSYAFDSLIYNLSGKFDGNR
jgi:hypothetical protein